MGKVIVFSGADDYNLAAVRWGLDRLGVDTISLDGSATAAALKHSIEISTAGALTSAGPFASVSSVWYFREKRPVGPAYCHAADRDFVEAEWSAMFGNIRAVASTCTTPLWVNEPLAARRAENKAVQLAAAARHGFRVPPTLFSNDPCEIRRFAREHGPVVVKHFTGQSWHAAATGKVHAATVTRLESVDGIAPAALEVAPAIYQRAVNKVADLRVTIIGNRIFTTRIAAHADAATLDWRPHVEQLETGDVELDPELQHRVLAVQHELGLVYGAMDLGIDTHGHVHFFEVNQGGQFLFMERASPRLPLLAAMCSLLASGDPDYSLPAGIDLSLATFSKSNAFTEWASGRPDQAQAFASFSAAE